MIKRIWFVDTNVLANWVLGGAGLLKKFCDDFNFNDEFFHIFHERYKSSISLIELITSTDFENDEFYIPFYSINELFSVLRDEARSIIHFKKALPLSRWNHYENIPELPQPCRELIYNETLSSFDLLFKNGRVFLFQDKYTPRTMKYYWENYARILFSNRYIQTQDTTLLLTAINNKADFFITLDTWLIRDAGDLLFDEFNLSLIDPENAIGILKNR
jgi:predicted nucleic acid-binding protein